MIIEELKTYQLHREDYKIGDNQYKCPLCGKIFSVKAFSQHIRKEHYNKSNNIKNSGGYNGHYSEDSFKLKVSEAAIKNNRIRNIQKFGEYKDFDVECAKCHKHFTVTEREKQFPTKKAYYCSKQCANSRDVHISKEQREKQSHTIRTQLAWLKENDLYEYQRRLGLLSEQNKTNKRFTSKNERLIRDFIIEKFPNDEWTFGGHLIINNLGLTRDLYSNKLKICVEYDGIWHFKDIHNQLKTKQEKDQALEKWCIINGYRLIRISESWFIEECNKDVNNVIPLIYKTSQQILKFGKEYIM